MRRDWRTALLADVAWQPDPPPAPNRLHWPDYASPTALRWGFARLPAGSTPSGRDTREVVLACWDFSVYGGSFGERDASALLAAADAAVRARRPLVTLVRSGGVRLQEGVAALVGMPRATLALRRLTRAGVAHVSVADDPTTGGVWAAIASRADLRCAVDDAVLGFSGPRVVEAVTGSYPGPDSHTAAAALRAGLVDAVVAAEDVAGWLGRVCDTLAASCRNAAPAAPPVVLVPRDGAGQVQAARSAPRMDGVDLLGVLLDEAVPLRGADETVAAGFGRLPVTGQPALAVALAARRGGRPTAAGYALLVRTAQLADRLEMPLVTLVDTPGAEPGSEQEQAGVAPGVGDAMEAVLTCRAPTVAVITGEGGSGGALAAACCDEVLICPDGYFAALAPEGAAATLRRDAGEAARLLRLRPDDLLALGFADAAVARPPAPQSEREAREPFVAGVVAAVARQSRQETVRRLAARERRWTAPLPGELPGSNGG